MKLTFICSVLALTFASVTPVFASDWPQWRGPNRDGLLPDARPALSALPAAPRKLWEASVGLGQAGVIVTGNKLIYADQSAGQETAHLLDLATGKELWKVAYDESIQFANAFGAGPRCTPFVDGDRVYVQSCKGEFRCLSLADGKTIWRTHFETDWGATFFGKGKENAAEAKETASRRHGNNGSAIVDGDRVFVPVGSPEKGTLVAFDKKTGKQLWTAGSDNTAYASLMVANIAGARQVVHLTADALMGVDVASGKILWRTPVKSGAKRHVLTPVIAGDSITIASSSVPLTKFKVTKDSGGFSIAEAWKNAALKITLATPVLVGGHLYGLGGPGNKTDFICVDFETGKTVWSQPGFGDYASIIALPGSLLALNSTGELFLVKTSPEKYEELGRFQTCGKTWSFPAYVDGKFFVRDDRKLTAWDLAK